MKNFTKKLMSQGKDSNAFWIEICIKLIIEQLKKNLSSYPETTNRKKNEMEKIFSMCL